MLGTRFFSFSQKSLKMFPLQNHSNSGLGGTGNTESPLWTTAFDNSILSKVFQIIELSKHFQCKHIMVVHMCLLQDSVVLELVGIDSFCRPQ